MKKIFEDILDDIDIESSEDSVINKLSSDTEIIPNRQDFDYVLYLGEFIPIQQLITSYNSDEDFIKNINFYFKESIDYSIKEKFNIYLDSYWIDDTIYTSSNNQIILQYSPNLIEYMPKEDENFIRKTQVLYQRIYFNFDNNLIHILRFLYIIANLRTHINSLYSIISNEELTYEDGDFFSMCDFFKHRLINKDKFVKYNLEIENFSNAIIEFFYEKKKLLKLDNFEKYNQKVYVIKEVKKIIQRLDKK